jgi:hypothetical protein
MENLKKQIIKKIYYSPLECKSFLILAGLFSLSMPALSYNSDIQKCINIADSSARLNCYDALFQENKSIQETIADPKKIEVLKMDEQKKKNYGLEKPKDDFSITAKILNVNKRGNYKIYVTLDNGQVWRSVKDIYDRTPVSKGQKVTIAEGFISGYVMKVEGKKTSLRVRRVK